ARGEARAAPAGHGPRPPPPPPRLRERPHRPERHLPHHDCDGGLASAGAGAGLRREGPYPGALLPGPGAGVGRPAAPRSLPPPDDRHSMTPGLSRRGHGDGGTEAGPNRSRLAAGTRPRVGSVDLLRGLAIAALAPRHA